MPPCICARVWYDARRCTHAWLRACAHDAAVHGICASATPALHTYLVLTGIINANSYIPARRYTEDRITDACTHRRRARAASVRARARVRSGAHAVRADTCEPFPSAWTACGFGAQAFYSAAAFNANIGAWNTASVTSLYVVCAAFSARRRVTAAGRARRVVDAARAVVRGGDRRCSRVCVCRRVGTRMRACLRV
jgi:hypothetical protein